jgi:uncharacterized repeat protein (TIGR03803 family)
MICNCSMRAVVTAVFLWLCLAPSANAGTIYADVYNFSPNIDGIHPRGSLIQVGSLLYGLTSEGSLFSFSPGNNIETTLYTFGTGGSDDGLLPDGSLIASGSVLYGMTSAGGTLNFGTVFSFSTSSNVETPLYSFLGYSTYLDGENPQGSLIQSGMTLYGLTSEGGSEDQGTIFSLNTSTQAETVMHSFSPGLNDGNGPTGSLVQSGSVLYGLTSAGGANQRGAIFAYSTSNSMESLLYSFGATSGDGTTPFGSLLQSATTLYGTTSGGGANGDGTIFAYNLQTGIESVLYSFGSVANDGSDPRGSLILVGDTLYGTTDNGGGSLNDGTIFSFDLENDSYSMLHAFDRTDGANPTGDLLAVGNTLYGLASNGGTHGAGVIFSVNVPEPASATLLAAIALVLLTRRRRPAHA